MQEILDKTIFNNSILEYLSSLATFIGGMAGVYICNKYILKKLKRWAGETATTIDDLVLKVAERSLIPVLFLGVFYASLYSLTLSEQFEQGFRTVAIILVTIILVRALLSGVNFALELYIRKSAAESGGERQLKGIRSVLNFVIWALALVFLLDNLGFKISAVVAGLGIGGIAVALAAQAVLGDFFSYFVIFFDKPFEIGDFIVVGDKMGVVEYIGIKTTRICALNGEQLVFSNTVLTNACVQNFKKMGRRRVVFHLGLVYQTTVEQLKRVPLMVKEIVEAQEDATFDRGHFTAYGASSLDFEFVYYVTGPDYNKYMDIQQAINLLIFEGFANEKIEFAYPTQTLFINPAAT
ncbi:MAG: mechanosensitive ion channel family protein [Gallionella sp.]|nr:mechanosensitive ion channel family protein [Gallionella sp.]MDP1939068.1 mechanosensitive ion channel family protein [Gallionella sp.]